MCLIIVIFVGGKVVEKLGENIFFATDLFVIL